MQFDIYCMQFNRGVYTSIRLLFLLVDRNVEISATALCYGLAQCNSRDDFRLKIYLESHFK